MKIGNVLSLFDGMSCIQLALNRAGIEYEKCYASEIDKFAIKVTQVNFPDTIHIGDVTKVNAKDLPKIDLLTFGSPCQGFSSAGKGLNFNDPRSALFFEALRILNEVREINPNVVFLMENVAMKHEHEVRISRLLGTNPIKINSALVSAQNRERLYWTNINQKASGLFGDMITDIPQPKDKGIILKDILENEVDEKYYLSGRMLDYLNNRKANFNAGKINYKTGEDKASCINKSSGSIDISDNIIIANVNQVGVINDNGDIREVTDNKSTCIDGNYFKGCDNHSQRTMIVAMRGRYNADGKIEQQPELNMDLIVHNTSPRTGDPNKGGTGHLSRKDGKVYCLQTSDCNRIEMQQRIRRLTPRECCRLQTAPDNYFWVENTSTGRKNIVSDSQIYKMVGNGWTIDMIAHILSYMK